jgi:hypothetical protein
VRTRPTAEQAPLVACSFEEPVCVHSARGVHPDAAGATLFHAESAMRAWRALELPRPLPDAGLGGNDAYDIYLLPPGSSAPASAGKPGAGGRRRGAAKLEVWSPSPIDLPVTTIDLGSVSGLFDRASAFSVMPPPAEGHGCAASAAVAHAIAQATVVGIDAAASEGTVAMTASYLASMVSPCPPLEALAVDAWQRAPEREITGGRAGVLDGAMLFPRFLDETYGTGAPGRVITALLSIAGQRTPPGSWQWQNEPDVFDALRSTLKERGKGFGDLLLDFAVARAFVGSRSDGAHLDDVAGFGDLGRVRFEWSVPHDSLPRRLAPLNPVSSTGMTYLWLDVAGVPKGSTITFFAEWELPVLFRWALVKVDATGAETGRIDVAGMQGSTQAERTVIVGDFVGLLIVGVNLGEITPLDPFDPDDAPFEPHSYTVTLAN